MSQIQNNRPLRQREPRVRDREFLSWLHQGIPCIACLIGGKPSGSTPGGDTATVTWAIEAAHQKLAIASAGWREGGGGVRVHDTRCVALCSWHHRLAPDACDVNQRAFWDRLFGGDGDRVADLCSELYAAYQTGADGAAVVRRFAAQIHPRAFQRSGDT